MPPQPRKDIFDVSPSQLDELMNAWGETPFRVRQIIAAAWAPETASFAQITTLPLALRRKLDEHFFIPAPWVPKSVFTAADGTAKAVFELSDGRQIESVSIPLPRRLTFCLSSQVGCALGCRFCATARMGFVRHLSTGEIVGQLRGLRAYGSKLPTNVVLMGMGEPLQNLDSVRGFVELISHPQALSWSPNKTTISTSGWLPGLEDLITHPLPAKLAFSFNAVTDEIRNRIMPVNRRYPLSDVLATLKKYSRAKSETLTVEYVLLKGVNDRLEDARLLVRLLKALPSKINLIPFNEIPGIPFQAPDPETVLAFKAELQKHGALTTLRSSRGAEIGAACGQLARQPQKQAA
ncbi:MAG: 23S rRNA (adenine(2503)-C(2))-methyltransferase RlmN [Candidatus Firestonebacteria bacterium]|nr:23S rRNA (adenine(2503)-C(2))-methyltransferase RlmN [Candidatus Firestonebacteria bacterium]